MSKVIAKKNAEFAIMTKSQKRVAVAKDVIASLKSGQIKAIQGTWVEPLRRENFVPENKVGDVEFCDILNKTKCKCCGLGALFVEAVKRFNKFKSVADVDHYDVYDYLDKIFSEEQLNMIECTFECGLGSTRKSDFKDVIYQSSYSYLNSYTSKTYDNCIRFGEAFKTPKLRMIAIMQNIVNNNGTFKP